MPERDFENDEILTADLNFHYYNMVKEDGELLQGYDVKLSTNDVICETAEIQIKNINYCLLIYK